MPLSMLNIGDIRQVNKIHGKDETRRFLESLGFVAGSTVSIVSENGGNFITEFAPAVYICLEGNAKIVGENYEKDVRRGDYFYLPFIAEGKFRITTDTEAVFIECLPSKQD